MRQGSGVWEGRVSETNLIPKTRVPREAKRVRQGPVGREPCADIISSLFCLPGSSRCPHSCEGDRQSLCPGEEAPRKAKLHPKPRD